MSCYFLTLQSQKKSASIIRPLQVRTFSQAFTTSSVFTSYFLRFFYDFGAFKNHFSNCFIT